MPIAESQRTALSRDVAYSRRMMEPFRKHREEALKQYVGSFYSTEGANMPVPINMIELGVLIYSSLLTPQDPQAMVTAKHKVLNSEASDLQEALNHQMREIKLGDTLRDAIQDAMFGAAIVLVDLADNGTVEIDGFLHDVKSVFAQQIDLDNFVFDMCAKRFDQCHFMGHRYEWRKDLLEQIPWVDKEAIADLEPAGWQLIGGTDEAVATISRGSERRPAEESLYPMVKLWDIWLPYEGLIYTYAANDSASGHDSALGKQIGMREWTGPECGPYHILGLEKVPGQLMPLPPVAIWRSLHETINAGYRKLMRQMEDQKEVLLVSGSATADGENIKRANDGEIIMSNNPDGVRSESFRGPNQKNHAFVIDAIQRLSWLAGGLDTLGGLSSQAETATQEKLLSVASNMRMSTPRAAVMRWIKGIIESVAWFYCYDPLAQTPITKKIPGSDIVIERMFTPAEMEGDYLEHNFDIAPHSMGEETPAEQFQKLQMLLQQFIMPLSQEMEKQGLSLDVEGLLREAAKLIGMPFLENVVMFSEMSAQQSEGPTGDPPRKSPTSSRTYNRVSSSATSKASQDQAMVQALMSTPEE